MAKFAIRKGCFENVADNAHTVHAITGHLTGIVTAQGDNYDKLVLSFTGENEEGEQQTNELTFRKYGDAAFKILRCLAGCVSQICSGSVISVTIEDREGEKSLIKVFADDQEILPAGILPDYFSDKHLTTDDIVNVIRCNIGRGFKVLLVGYENTPGDIVPDDECSPENAEAIRTYLAAHPQSGAVVKKAFFSKMLRDAYVEGALNASDNVFVFTDIPFVDLATDVTPETAAEGGGVDENNEDNEG